MGAAMRMTQGNFFTSLLLISGAILAIVAGSAALGHHDDVAAEGCPGTGATDDRLACLTIAYAPLLKFDSNEAFFPSSVDYFLPYMKLIIADGSDIPNQPEVLNASNLVYVSEKPLTTYLTTKNPLKESETDSRFMPGQKPSATSTVPIYTSIVRKAGELYDFVYYAFYPYNLGKPIDLRTWGNHVGDWEHVTLRISFKNSSNPRLIQAYTSQHSTGECLTPLNMTFVLDSAHPIFYVAKGSHGTYNKPGTTMYNQLPKLADEHDGMNAVKWETWNNVAVRVEGQPLASEYMWWGYNGRWGNREGPTMAFGQHVLANGPDYPGSHTLTFQHDNPAFENCLVIDS